ncbi:MAG: hypothetical protein B7Y80_01425 [Hyphomicrobium sp. 32-62-53]|nr:MAG: hypothetical protein B7Z29_01770 [Hyphomicrobium sp. 12-62-95]OYY01415.1 MAG: hypothetical protein B7Y80_01425 [Hyphomicrobium sp. 32-62-53]
MAQLSSRLVISLVDRVSGPAKGIARSLRMLDGADGSHFVAMGRNARKTGEALRGFGTSAAVAGYGMYSFVNATKEFNESEFGYTFAKLPDHFKGLRVDMKSLGEDTKTVSDDVRRVSKDLGLIPKEVMKARTEVEKVGRSGALGESMFSAALGLNMADSSMTSDVAVKYLNAVYSSFEKQRLELGKQMGLDLTDPKQAEYLDYHWLRSVAAKSAFAAAKSSLDPRELVEGARQYAPQWAMLGMSPDQTLGALAHGSNYGFMAPELGTAFKSWANRLVKPTAAGLGWMNTLGLDRSKWTKGFGAAAPKKATTAIDALLGNQVYTGKGGKEFRGQVRGMLDEAAAAGTTATPEFQGKLVDLVMKRLGSKYAGRGDEVADAISNATLVSDGGIDVIEFIREAKAKGMTSAAMLEVLEGRHFARNSPMFQFFDQLVGMIDGLKKIDGSALDAIEEARKGSRAGKLQALTGSWEELLLTIQDTGINDSIVAGLKSVVSGLASLNPEVVKWGAALIAIGAVAAPAVFAFRAIAGLMGMIGAGGKILAGALGLGAAAAAPAAGRGLFSLGAGAAGGAAATAAAARMVSGMGAGGQMISGMSAAGAAAGAGAAGKGGGTLAKLAGLGAKGLSRLWLPLTLGYAARESWQGYQKDGLAGAILNPLTFGLYSGGSAQAAEAPGPTIAAAGGAVATGQAPGVAGAQGNLAGMQSAAGALPGVVNTAIAQVRGTLAGVNLAAEGQRIIESLAAGMRAGIPAVQSAASQAAAASSRATLRGAFTDGGR